jgi:hypothetical protein
VAVNPDRVLAKVARERGWEVMQFTKPVRLRDRVSVPSLSMTATAAGITAAASVGALVAWRLDPGARSGRDTYRLGTRSGVAGAPVAGALGRSADRLGDGRELLRKDGAAWRRRHPGQR